jgi:type II secretory pathway component PulK
MQLPNMTDAIANSIIFWIDPKATQRSSGATDEYYMSQTPPYHAKNAPLDNTEELLFVQGVTPQLLFGNDKNRNGILDPDEDDGAGALDLGWSAYLTAYSHETNVDSAGNPRIYVNDPNLQNLQTYLTNAGFDDSITSFILAARMYGLTAASGGGSSSGGGGTGSGTGTGTGTQNNTNTNKTTTPTGKTTTTTSGDSDADDKTNTPTNSTANSGAAGATKSAGNGGLTRSSIGNVQSAGGSNTISSLYGLINATVSIPGSNGQAATVYVSPLTDTGSIKQYLPMILDKLTTKKSANLPGRINVNTAPSAVLSALAPNGTPLLDVSTVQMITGTRPSTTTTDTPDPIFATPTWLITEASVPVATVQSLEQYLTASSQVFRVQSLGHFDSGGPTARVEAVIDTNAGRPRIIYYRDLTSLGKGFSLPAPNP